MYARRLYWSRALSMAIVHNTRIVAKSLAFFFIDPSKNRKALYAVLSERIEKKYGKNKSEGTEKKHSGLRELHARPDSSVTQPYMRIGYV